MDVLSPRSVRLPAALAAALLAGSGAWADGEPPALQISWSVDSGTINQVEARVTNAEGSLLFYEGEMVDPGTGLTLEYDLEADLKTYLGGNLTIANELPRSIEVFIEVQLPFTPNYPGSSELEGSAVVGLTAGSGGGAISSVETWIWQTVIDGEVAGPEASLFAHPFELAAGGAGNLAASADFGVPDPVPGPPVQDTIGFEINFALTDLDVAAVTSELIVDGSCSNDLDGDGTIGISDLLTVLTAWGHCPPAPCPADLNADGQVGILDMLVLLENWGPC